MNRHALVHPEGDPEHDLCHTSSCRIHGLGAPVSRIEQIRTTFSNILTRTGLSHVSLVAKVLHRLHLAALLCEEEEDTSGGRNSSTEADFSMRILFLGRTGVGKSATINSIFDERKVATNSFLPETDRIQEIKGTVNGIPMNIIDTPGLLPPSAENTKKNREILLSLRRLLRRSPPDVVLYFERLEFVSCSGYDDSRLFNLITDVFGRAFWCNTLLVMTHSYSYLPQLPYTHADYYLSRCVQKVQSCINRAVSLSDSTLQNPVLLVENNPLYYHFEKLLPDVHHDWRSRFFLLCLCTKALADASAFLRVQNSFKIGFSGGRPPLSLSDLFSSFLSFTESQFQSLNQPDYRETLLLEKSMKESASSPDPDPFPLPEMTMPPSFYSDSQAYRYRGISTPTGIITTTPVLDPHSWDNDPGFGGFNIETNTIPVLARAECRLGLDVESIRGDSIYTVNGGLCFPTFVCNRAGCGISVTSFREKLYGGLRVEDVLSLGKRMKVVVEGGGMFCGGESCRGGSVTGAVIGRSAFLALTAAVVCLDREEMALCCRFRLDFRPLRSANVSVRGEVGSSRKGVVSVRFVASEYVEIVVVSMMIVLGCLVKNVRKREDGWNV